MVVFFTDELIIAIEKNKKIGESYFLAGIMLPNNEVIPRFFLYVQTLYYSYKALELPTVIRTDLATEQHICILNQR